MVFTFSADLSYRAFLTTSFLATSLSLLNSTGTGANLTMSNLSTLVFRLAKFVFSAKLEVSTSYIFQICFCCIVGRIIFNVNIPSKTSKWLRKVLTHFYTREFHSRSFLSIQLLNELLYPFLLRYNILPFLLSTFSIVDFS